MSPLTKPEKFFNDFFTFFDEHSKLITVDKYVADDNFVVTLRTKFDSNYAGKSKSWVNSFCNQTNTKYQIRSTNPNSTRIDYKATYRCREKRRAGCPSKIDVVVKKTTINTMQKDPLLKAGYNVLVKVYFQHSHER